MIYFILNMNTDLIKIGYSCNVNKRFTELQRQYGTNLKIIGVLNSENLDKKDELTDVYVERQLHIYFRKLHVEGEWFKNEKTLKMFIKQHCKLYQKVDIEYVNTLKVTPERVQESNKNIRKWFKKAA